MERAKFLRFLGFRDFERWSYRVGNWNFYGAWNSASFGIKMITIRGLVGEICLVCRIWLIWPRFEKVSDLKSTVNHSKSTGGSYGSQATIINTYRQSLLHRQASLVSFLIMSLGATDHWILKPNKSSGWNTMITHQDTHSIMYYIHSSCSTFPIYYASLQLSI